jgi:hypothetical protein
MDKLSAQDVGFLKIETPDLWRRNSHQRVLATSPTCLGILRPPPV